MKLSITIALDNDIFQGCDGGVSEVERLLNSVASRIPDPLRETQGAYSLHDANGNHCGTFRIEKTPSDHGPYDAGFFDGLPWQHSAGDDEDALICTVELGDVPFHCWALKVEEINNIQRPVRDPHRRYADLGNICAQEGAFRTMNIKGFEGDWVVWFEPYTA